MGTVKMPSRHVVIGAGVAVGGSAATGIAGGLFQGVVSREVLDQAMSIMSVFLAFVALVAALWAREHARVAAGGSPRQLGAGLLRTAGAILPGAARRRWPEEWAGELYDLRADGARWWRRTGYVLEVLLCTAPVLAVTLRLSRVRAVD